MKRILDSQRGFTTLGLLVGAMAATAALLAAGWVLQGVSRQSTMLEKTAVVTMDLTEWKREIAKHLISSTREGTGIVSIVSDVESLPSPQCPGVRIQRRDGTGRLHQMDYKTLCVAGPSSREGTAINGAVLCDPSVSHPTVRILHYPDIEGDPTRVEPMPGADQESYVCVNLDALPDNKVFVKMGIAVMVGTVRKTIREEFSVVLPNFVAAEFHGN